MKEKIVELMEMNPIISGAVFILIGVGFILLRMNKNNSFDMENHIYISWRLLVKTWGAALLFLSIGIITILKNI